MKVRVTLEITDSREDNDENAEIVVAELRGIFKKRRDIEIVGAGREVADDEGTLRFDRGVGKAPRYKTVGR